MGAEFEPFIRTIAARTGGPSPEQARRYLELAYRPVFDGKQRRADLLSWSVAKLTAENAEGVIAHLTEEVTKLEAATA